VQPQDRRSGEEVPFENNRQNTQNQGAQRRRPSPSRKPIADPAPAIRQRRYSSDMSDEDFNAQRRPPPPRRRKNPPTGGTGSQKGPNKVPLQVEVANVADILAKQGYESQNRIQYQNQRNNKFDSRNHSGGNHPANQSPGKNQRYREVKLFIIYRNPDFASEK
jgi:hypothetical protein